MGRWLFRRLNHSLLIFRQWLFNLKPTWSHLGSPIQRIKVAPGKCLIKGRENMENYQLQVAGGSIPGSDHLTRGNLLIGRNNQDAFRIDHVNGYAAATICDGCGSQLHSEVGAQLGCMLWQNCLLRQTMNLTSHRSIPDQLWERALNDFLAQLRVLAISMTPPGGSFTKTVEQNLLFTIIGALWSQEMIWPYSFGDGILITNDYVNVLEPSTGNQPCYPAYRIIKSTFDEKDLQLTTHPPLILTETSYFAIGSDGVNDLIAAEHKLIPGTEMEVGPISQFWESDVYFRNNDALRRRLALINSEVIRYDQQGSRLVKHYRLLRDDTTLVVLRRNPTRVTFGE